MKKTFSEEDVAKSLANAKADYERQERKRWRYTFAGMALQGLVACGGWENMSSSEAAHDCAILADAILAELEKDGSDPKA